MVGEEHLTNLFKLCEWLGVPGSVCLELVSKQKQVLAGFSASHKGEDAKTGFLLGCKLLQARTMF